MLAMGVVLLSMAGLAACSNSANGTNKHVHLSETANLSKKPTKAGDKSGLNVAEVSDSPFSGITSPELMDNGEDLDMFAPGGNDNMFNQNNHYEVTKGGLANLKLNKKNNTATITLRKNAKWSNGMKVTAKDVEYPYEVIANKDSKSQSYSDVLNDIKGLSAYHNGKAKTISGITFPDGPKGRKTVIHYNHLTPGMKYNGNDYMNGTVEPYEYLKNVPISKLASSPQVRKHPLFVGPYKMSKEVDGESTSWVPNKYYWGKKPNIKRVHIQVVSTSNFAEAMKTKKYDFASGTYGAFSDFPHVKNLKDYTTVGKPFLAYGNYGFNVGYQNKKGNTVEYKHGKMSNPSLRRAMMYALNLNMVYKKFGYGLKYRANTLVPPIYGKYHASYKSQPGFPYNMKKARQLLKDAGYKKRHGSKWLSQPNGKPLTIHLGAMSGSSVGNAQSEYMLQQWRKLGLNAKYTNGKPMEMNSYYAYLSKPKQKAMDVFESAFEINADPSEGGMYGPGAAENYSHFASKENNKLLTEMDSKKAFNLKYRVKVFKKWQKYMNKEAAVVPDDYMTIWTPVNHRVTGFNYSPGANQFWSNLGLNATSEK